MAEKEGRKIRAAIYCRVGNPKDAGLWNAEKLPERKGVDADAHKESRDIRKGFNRA